jgi:phage gp29-like protein
MDPDAEPPGEYDDQGNLIPLPITPERQALLQAQEIQNGACAVLPPNAKLQVIEAKNTGEPFMNVIDLVNREITKTIIGQTLMTEEGAHMSRSAATTHQDVFGILVRHVKLSLAARLRQDVIIPLLRYNYGDDGERLCPVVALGETEHQDFANNATAIAQLMRAGYFDVSQYEGIDNMLALPPRDAAHWAAVLEQEQALLDQQALLAAGGPAAPGSPSASGGVAASGGSPKTLLQQDEATSEPKLVAKIQATRAASRVGLQ